MPLPEQATDKAFTKTTPGTIMGTVPYMSPEQVNGGDIDARSDIFSFGCVLYEMLAGQRPFQGGNAADTMLAIAHQSPARLSSEKKIPARLERAVARCLEKDRAQRFQSADELFRELHAIRHELQRAPWYRSPLLLVVAATVLAVTLTVLLVVSYLAGSTPGLETPINSIAVLPFANSDNDPNIDYLGDGITERLINNLSQLPELKVKSRSSVFQFAKQPLDVQKAGRTLGVGAVLTGRVRERGDALLISVELVDVRDNSLIWGEQYNRKLDEVLKVQEEIATRVAEKLKLKLTSSARNQLAKQATNNPEAFRLYLKARYHMAKLSREGLEKGREYIDEAIKLDQNFAAAYIGLSYYYIQAVDLIMSPQQGFPSARDAALKALER